MTVSPVSFVGSAPDKPAATPVTPFRKTPIDPVGYLPEESRVCLALLKAAKADAESAMENATEAGVPASHMGGLQAERAVTASNLRSVDEYVSNLRAPVEALLPASVGKKTIDGVRAEIAAVEERWTALQLMRPTRAEQIDKLKAMVAGSAANCAPETFRLAHDHSNAADPALAFRQLLGLKGDALGLLAAIFPDAIVEKLSETIPDDPDGALPHAERMSAIEQCRKDLLHLGWQEECLIRQAATPPLRRATALAESLLGVVAR